MKKIFIVTILVFICCLLFYFCHSLRRYNEEPIKKEIKTNVELEKGDLLYEDSRAVVYFDRKITLEVLKNNNYLVRNCGDKNRLIDLIENIEKGNTIIFAPLEGKDDYFDENFKYRIVQSLLLNSRFSVLNKSTGIYEKYLIYNRSHAGWGCCHTYFEFPNGDWFITTNIFTDNIIIEDCDE